jgi:multiple sugar transport system permease protein
MGDSSRSGGVMESRRLATHQTVLPWYRAAPFRLLSRGLVHLALLGIGVTFLLPFWWMVATALKPKRAVFQIPPLWFPFQDTSVWDRLYWEHFPAAVNFIPFGLYLQNTLFIAVMSCVGVFLSAPLVAYGLSRIRWPGRDVLFALTIATLFLPSAVTIIPLFLIWRTLDLVGTPWPLIIPHWVGGGAFFIFLLRQFFMTIPQELSEAARIDGAGELRIYAQIILPLAKPALATVVLFQFLMSWREFFGPLIYLSRRETYTLSLGLTQFRSEWDVEWPMLMAASVLITFPVIVLFFFTQKQFVQGITLTGIKG